MTLRFLLQLSLFFAVIFFGTGLLLSMTGEVKTYGVKCTFVAQEGNVKNGKVYVTTGDKCHQDLHGEELRISQRLSDDGSFYRNINGSNGDNVSLWVEFEGQTVLHACKVLNYSTDVIDFGQISVPKTTSATDGHMPVVISNQSCSLQQEQQEVRKAMGLLPAGGESNARKASITGH